MSEKEKSEKNVWQFDKKISIGDVLIILTLIAMAVHLQDRVDNHEVRLNKVEAKVEQHDTKINEHGTQLAVIVSHGDQNHGATQLRNIKE